MKTAYFLVFKLLLISFLLMNKNSNNSWALISSGKVLRGQAVLHMLIWNVINHGRTFYVIWVKRWLLSKTLRDVKFFICWLKMVLVKPNCKISSPSKKVENYLYKHDNTFVILSTEQILICFGFDSLPIAHLLKKKLLTKNEEGNRYHKKMGEKRV